MKRLILILVLVAAALPALADDRGPMVSIELRDVEVSDMLRALGQEHQINIVVDESVTGRVTVSLRNVPLWDAVESILKGKGYTYVRDGNIVRVVRAAEDEELVTKTVSVSYANPKEIEAILRKMLSKRGEVASDARSNTIIIKDIPANIPKAIGLVRVLDTVPPQVMIDARIVEVNRNMDQSLGIQWGGSYSSGDFSLGGATGANGFAVNLPSLPGSLTAPDGPFQSALRIGLLTSRLDLDIRLSAMEENGDARILSNPRILTGNNKKASIATGEKIRVRSTSGTTTVVTGGTSNAITGTEELEALLKLEVTPQITPEGTVMMNIFTKKEEFNFRRTVDNIPSKQSREATTDVTVRDGETIVLGGIITRSDQNLQTGVPGLAKIPVLGWLFKKEDTFVDEKELLIFITPTIAKDAARD